MKVQIRRGVFETNSSSTHSMTIISDEDYQKLCDETLLVRDGKDFCSEPEARKKNAETARRYHDVGEETIKEYEETGDIWLLIPNGDVNWDIVESYYIPFYMYEEFRSESLEEDTHEYTTKSGDKIHIFCWFGYDG